MFYLVRQEFSKTAENFRGSISKKIDEEQIKTIFSSATEKNGFCVLSEYAK
jgi:DNA-binding TFAR19-related protein (PDSD5 family)